MRRYCTNGRKVRRILRGERWPRRPELLTVKACRVLKACPVIAAPQSQSGEQLALSIAGQAVDLDGKASLSLPFTMSRDPEVLAAAWEKNADLVAAYLDRGADVAMVVLGDVSTYSTYCYVMERLKQRGYPTQMIPGVTSFAAIAAPVGEDGGGALRPACSPGLSPGPTGGAGPAGDENFDEIGAGATAGTRCSARKGPAGPRPARGQLRPAGGAGLPGPAGA